MFASLRRQWKRFVGPSSASVSSPQRFALRFHEFRSLLKANHEVLDIIAEIQRRLEAQGNLGLDFLRSRHIEASAKVYLMIRSLNRISGDRYRQLGPILHEICGRIEAAFGEQGQASGRRMLLPLAQVEPGMEHLCGGKAANLGVALREGLPVPAGLVITTEAFRTYMKESGLGGQVRELLMLQEGDSFAARDQLEREIGERFLAHPPSPDLGGQIEQAALELALAQGAERLSFRSSAVGEDSGSSFAGLYHSELAVEPGDALKAWCQVLASLYSARAVAFRQSRGLTDFDAEMAVLVQVMVQPTVSGVIYTTDPLAGGQGPLLVSAVPGLGQSLVDGSLDPDLYEVDGAKVRPRQLGRREQCLVSGPRGLVWEPLPTGANDLPLLSELQLWRLAELGRQLQERFGCPQDVEWAIDPAGEIWILQSRPLAVLAAPHTTIETERSPLFAGGQTAQPGAAAGPVHLVRNPNDLTTFPPGAVLVARHSWPAVAALLPTASALVTEVGGIAGHLASMTREFGVPAIVGATGATGALVSGQEVTVDASACQIFAGRVEELLAQYAATVAGRGQVTAVPLWLGAVPYLVRLNLTDPQSAQFKPENCRTLHDLIRFMHEKSFQEMFRLGDEVGASGDGNARRMNVQVPFELWVVDLGGGLAEDTGPRPGPEQVVSVPGKAFLDGLTDPAVDWKNPRPVSLTGLASVMSANLLNPPQSGERAMGQRAYFIVGRDYVNFNCRVGYHFTAVDSFCGPILDDNYVSFRFHGGAATEDRRHLRARLVERILTEMGFVCEVNGDAVSAFLKKHSQEQTAQILARLGILVLFTRQMDMLMTGPQMVDWLARAFAEGNYNLDPSAGAGSGS